MIFLREIDDQSELPFRDPPGIKRVAESVQGLTSIWAEAEEAQHLGDPGVGEPDRPGEGTERIASDRSEILSEVEGRSEGVPRRGILSAAEGSRDAFSGLIENL